MTSNGGPDETEEDSVCCALTNMANDRTTWCGDDSPSAFVFQSASHAALNGRQNGFLRLCRECRDAIVDALDNGFDDGEDDEAPHYQGGTGPGLKITSYSAVGTASMGKPNNSGGSGVGVKTFRDLFVDLIGTSIDRGVQHFNGIRKVPGTTLDPETKTYTLTGESYFAPGSVIDDGVLLACSGHRLNWDGPLFLDRIAEFAPKGLVTK